MRTRHRRLTMLTIPLLAAPLGLAACSSGTSGGSAAGGVALAPAALCRQLNGVFADGPDPDADPVGYALSQILPLRGVHSSDRTVTTALDRLIAADRDLVQSNGADKAAGTAIKKSDHAINQACPGVAP